MNAIAHDQTEPVRRWIAASPLEAEAMDLAAFLATRPLLKQMPLRIEDEGALFVIYCDDSAITGYQLSVIGVSAMRNPAPWIHWYCRGCFLPGTADTFKHFDRAGWPICAHCRWRRKARKAHQMDAIVQAAVHPPAIARHGLRRYLPKPRFAGGTGAMGITHGYKPG